MNVLTRLGKQIGQESENEAQNDAKRVEVFRTRFPRFAELPILGSFFRFIVRENWIALTFLFLILFAWTLIKLPYFSYNFTGEHELKYNTYVEPALHMIEMKNPFWHQRKYLANPVSNPQGIFNDFSHIPVLEWSLAGTYTLLPQNSLEWNTRLLTHLIGMLTLIAGYIFLRYWISKFPSLIVISLLALNPILSFASFVTVYDNLLLLCTFLTLAFLSESLKTKDPVYIMSAGLCFGLGLTMKDSIGVWLLPAALLLLWLQRKNISFFIQQSLTFFFIAAIPYGMLVTAVSSLPRYPIRDAFIIVFWLLALLLLIHYRHRFSRYIATIVAFVQKFQIWKYACIGLVFIGITLYWLENKDSNTVKEFLTDGQLILYWPMYKELLSQLREYVTTPIAWLAIAGIICSPLIFFQKTESNKRILHMGITLGFSSVFYLILASKVIFFHNYYTLIILVFLCFSAALTLYGIAKLLNKRIFMLLFLANAFIWLFPVNLHAIQVRLEKQRPEYLDALTYLRQHTDLDDIYIDESFVMTLTIGSGRPSFANVDILDETKLEDSIAIRGLAKTMQAYHVRYLITANAEPDYQRLAPLFTKEDMQSSYYRRSDIIKSQLDPSYHFFQDQDLRMKIVEESRLKDKFRLEYSTGYYNFFTFVE